MASHTTSLRNTGFGLALSICTVLAGPTYAQANLNLGQLGTSLSGIATVTSSGTTASGTYQYYDADGSPTSLPATQTSYDFLRAYSHSTANVSGGSFFALDAADSSIANVSGGSFLDLITFNTSIANVSGGDMSYLRSADTSTANVSGGSVFDLRTFDASTANISGGSFTRLATVNTSTANVIGGQISNLETSDTSTLTLFGTGFTETFLGDYSANGYQLYSVTGSLQNGNALNANYYDYGGKLVFSPPAAVPEASSVVSLGLMLALGLGGVVWSARRRKEQSTG